MSDITIKVQGLGKQYRIGKRQRYNTLRDRIAALATAPFRRLHTAAAERDGQLFWALKDVSFEVNQGEVLGIIGRNGAGKSTLLKILSRITDPTEGVVEIDGRVGSLLEVGTGFHPELTGRENIYLNGAILGMHRGEIQRKFDEIVAFSEVEKFLDTPVKHFSSGMYMRLAFAVAAHLEPEILVVDEVLAVGDAAFQKKCMGKMGDVASHGRTVLFVSHNMNAIEKLCGHVLMLSRGRIQRMGTDIRGIIREFLGGDAEAQDTGRWDNPGDLYVNPWFKPNHMSFRDEAGNFVLMPAANDKPFHLRIEGEVQTLDPDLEVGIAVFAEDGELLFRSFQNDEVQERWPRLRKGRNVLQVKMPARLLNEGTYRVELMVARRNDKWIFCPGREGPPVYLTILGRLSDSPLWIGARPGLLAPVLNWQEIA
ncbi:MAG: ABC transporter ATP-binding protein [Tepidisphaeraceae bacterium]|jgi:lipopolysaccharide transport system ATP-binding protein